MGLKLINIVLPVSCVLLRQLHAMASDQMKYIHFEKGCEPDGLSVQTTPVPALRSREVLVKVFATAINRADILQRRGMYPAPPGESDILGLEASGTVEARADDCTSQWHIGDRVMALLAGGGYAEYVAVPEDVLMPVPSGMSLTTAAGIPEVWLTAYQLLHLGFKIFFFIVGGVYLLYLLFLLVRAYTELRSMPYFDLRLKFMTLLMLIVLSISITITVLKFGRAALQDNFVAELSSHYKNSAEFVAFYGLLNIYMFTMAFVYSPTNNAVFETHFKDNPGLSMMNDSDEEVHYGSETESVGMTRVRPAAVGKYDSD